MNETLSLIWVLQASLWYFSAYKTHKTIPDLQFLQEHGHPAYSDPNLIQRYRNRTKMFLVAGTISVIIAISFK